MASLENRDHGIENRAGYTHLFSGAGIGLLIGSLIGLSLSPVVGTVIGGLVALLAAFLAGCLVGYAWRAAISAAHRHKIDRRVGSTADPAFTEACRHDPPEETGRGGRGRVN